MADTLFAKEIPGGYSWTLASRLGQILQEIEGRFGARDRSFTILGIEFEESGPRIWYPGNCRNIIIQLSLTSRTSWTCALYELAHEAIHLLAPSGGQHATVLEEGLATFFSWDYSMRMTGKDYRSLPHGPGYKEAALLVEQILSLNPDFFLKIRNHCSELRNITAQLIQEICPEYPIGSSALLSLPFSEFTHLINNDQPFIDAGMMNTSNGNL